MTNYKKFVQAYNVKVLYLLIVFVIIIIVLTGYAILDPSGLYCLMTIGGGIGCGGGGSGGAGNFDFNISLSQVSGIVTAGNSTFTTVTATLLKGKSQLVSFSCLALPIDATCSFSLSSCNPTCNSALTISTSLTTMLGTYNITVKGASRSLVKATNFTLNVREQEGTMIVSVVY